MSVVVKNVGASARTAQNNHNTIGRGNNNGMGDQGTVRVVVNNREWSFGPNESRTFADDGIGIAVAAADARLRVVDSRDNQAGTLRT